MRLNLAVFSPDMLIVCMYSLNAAAISPISSLEPLSVGLLVVLTHTCTVYYELRNISACLVLLKAPMRILEGCICNENHERTDLLTGWR